MDAAVAASSIKQEALRLGFASCGICRPEFVGDQANYLKQWLEKGFQGSMDFMSRNLEKRTDPRLLAPGVRSIVMVALNYFPPRHQPPKAAQIAYYAYGKDYHLVMKEKLRLLLDYIREKIAPAKGKMVCDTAPFLEKYHAVKAGMGWIGKNTQLIIPGKGSYFFLGALLLDIPLEQEKAQTTNRCGDCNRCIEACPTRALSPQGQLNATRCLSYLTIEYQGELPDFYRESVGNRVYGCDACTQACPWNQEIKPTEIEAFHPSEQILNLTPDAIVAMTEPEFDARFHESAIHRIGLKQLKRNVIIE